MDLLPDERLHYRDQLRAARYSALANAEGFEEICFALEALGLHLKRERGDMGKYKPCIQKLSLQSSTLHGLAESSPGLFSTFDALYETVRRGRNDAMHTGVYARNVTHKAVELCIGIEEALMAQAADSNATISQYMVKSPITLERWQPVAYARQLMLLHSISYLPLKKENGDWVLLSETSLVRYLRSSEPNQDQTAVETPAKRLGNKIGDATNLVLIPATLLTPDQSVADFLQTLPADNATKLWLVVDNLQDRHLVGVFMPFDLL